MRFLSPRADPFLPNRNRNTYGTRNSDVFGLSPAEADCGVNTDCGAYTQPGCDVLSKPGEPHEKGITN